MTESDFEKATLGDSKSQKEAQKAAHQGAKVAHFGAQQGIAGKVPEIAFSQGKEGENSDFPGEFRGLGMEDRGIEIPSKSLRKKPIPNPAAHNAAHSVQSISNVSSDSPSTEPPSSSGSTPTLNTFQQQLLSLTNSANLKQQTAILLTIRAILDS